MIESIVCINFYKNNTSTSQQSLSFDAMLKIKSILCAFVAVLAISSCSEDFKVGAPYKEVTLVFGLLDKSDTAHYIKITKGFFDEKNNNLVAAKVSDSIYYNVLDVKLHELNAAGNIVNSSVLQKVNLVNEGIVKDTGIFASSPAYAYKLKQVLKSNVKYRIEIKNPSTGKTVSGETYILADEQGKFDVDILPYTTLDYQDPTSYSEYSFVAPANSAIIEMYLRTHYLEETFASGSSSAVLKQVDIPFFTRRPVTLAGSTMTHRFEHPSVYSFLLGGFGTASFNVKRQLDTNEIVFYVGGKELKTYIDVTSAQGGITADQIQPTYTNMQGSDVYGIFSSRGRKIIYNIPFGDKLMDSLRLNPKAAGLAVTGRTPF
jgi:hypothetical protein